MNHSNADFSLEEYLCLKASKKCFPLSISFELTPHCNMNCEMCYVRLSKKEQEKIKPLRSLNDWISLAKQFKQMGTLFILLTGGEPLLYPHFKELYLELIKMGFIITINSNGTLINKDHLDLFTNNMPRRINITLYGASNETYTKVTGDEKGFDKALQGIQLLKESNIPVKLNCSMLRTNMCDTSKILDLSESLDIPLEYNTYIFPCNRNGSNRDMDQYRITPKEAAQCELYIKKRQRASNISEIKQEVLRLYTSANTLPPNDSNMSCRAGKSSCWINWKGEMTPCVFFDAPAIDVFENSVSDAWSFISEDCSQKKLPVKCSTCKHRFNCNVCFASTRWESPNSDTPPKYLCTYMDEVIASITKDNQENIH